MAVPPGTRLGPYEITSLIGAGGMGEVYRARDTKLDRDVALKVLPESVANDAERLARFAREAKTLAALNHPHIAHIHGLEESNGMRALVMELVEGQDLSQRVARGVIPVDEAIPIARQIAEALEAAHEQGIIHRDLKPANIKLRDDGTVKVLDFGLAKALDPTAMSSSDVVVANSPTITSPAMTMRGVILGTAAYMSPEQAKGKAVDRRTDVFAFGAVLYEMLTRERAFDGENITDTIVAVVSKDPDWSRLPPAMPARLTELLRRCLEKDQRRRLRDIGEARVLLTDLQSGASSVVDARVEAKAPPRPLWKRAVPLAAAAIVGGIAVGAAMWTLTPQRVATVTRFRIALPEGQQFTNTQRQLLSLSNDGTQLVYVANSRLYLRGMSELDAHVIPGTESGNGVLNPVFSPDGQSVAFWEAASGTIKRTAISGGTPVTICPANRVFGLDWSTDGILFGQSSKGILRVSADGGVPEVVAAANDGELLSQPRMLPGGKALIFSLTHVEDSWDSGRIVVRTFGGEQKTLLASATDGRYVSTGHLVFARSGVLMAVPFDLGSLTVSGAPVPVVEGVRRTMLNGTVASIGTNSSGAAQFAFSSNGVLVHIPGPVKSPDQDVGGRSLGLVDRKGLAERLKMPVGSYTTPRVSRDGRFVAFGTDDTKEAEIWIAEIDGKTATRRLTNEGRNRSPIWSPDGQWVAFASDRGGEFAIFRQRADGSGAAEALTKPEAGTQHAPQSWSPDGTTLLFTSQKGQENSLWTLSLKDRRPTPFGNVSGDSLVEAQFSPDGRWVAYANREKGESNPQVYLQPFPTTGAKYLVGRGGHAFWTPKGDALIMNVSPQLSEIVPVTTSPQVAFGQRIGFPRSPMVTPNPTVSPREIDSMPDGEHVLAAVLASVGSDATPEIIVTFNWFDELKRRVPRR